MNALHRIAASLLKVALSGLCFSAWIAVEAQPLSPDMIEWTALMDSTAGLLKAHEYISALKTATFALEIAEGRFGREDTLTANAYSLLGKVHYVMGNYAESEPLWKRALEIRRAVLGNNHIDVAKMLNNLAILYKTQGLYYQAEPLYEQTLEIREQTYGPDHPEVAACLNNVANLYLCEARYGEAEAYYKRALEITKKTLGDKHPEVAANLNNLAALYHMQGRYADEEPLYLQSIQIWREALGESDPLVAQGLNNLAYLYHDLGRYEEAEPLYKEALRIYETALRPDHPKVGVTLNNLARMYRDQTRYEEAEPLVRRALEIGEKELGADHTDVAEILGNLGDLLLLQGRLDDAEWAYNRALTSLENSVGVSHPIAAGIYHGMAEIALLRGGWTQAIKNQEQAYLIRREGFREGFDVLSERSALEYSRFLQAEAANYISMLVEAHAGQRHPNEEIAEIVFSVKGQVSDGIFDRHRSINLMMALSDSLRATRSLLSDIFIRGPSSTGGDIFDQEVSELTNRKDRLEAALARGASESSASDQAWDVTYRKIAGRLPDGSALIEFMKYDHRIRPDHSEPSYVAIAITRDRPPKAIALGSAAVIDTAVAVYRRHFSNPQSIDLEAYKAISTELTRLVWQPIASEIKGVHTVFIAPDGALNIVSFTGLIDQMSSHYIIEDYAIHYLASGRDFIKLSQSWDAGNGLLAFGDPDYDVLPGETPGLLDELAEKVKGFSLSGLTRNVRSECAELDGIVVPRLPETRTEIERVKERWSDASKEPVIVHFGADASEEALKNESCGRRVIHLATHGYYIGERCRTVLGKDRVISENPLLLSGLFLAGANQSGSTADKLGTEDGIVTAEEVANLNLNGVQLVVLSACETGLGEVYNGEGVYGLRRSFQMAGARTVMSALWQVDDKSTADLMADLFVQDQQSIAESMRESALKQIRQRRANNQSDHPFYWAAFVANGDWKVRK